MPGRNTEVGWYEYLIDHSLKINSNIALVNTAYLAIIAPTLYMSHR
jgi:hypothetical protein